MCVGEWTKDNVVVLALLLILIHARQRYISFFVILLVDRSTDLLRTMGSAPLFTHFALNCHNSGETKELDNNGKSLACNTEP